MYGVVPKGEYLLALAFVAASVGRLSRTRRCDLEARPGSRNPAYAVNHWDL
ncbi:hypothetical protein GCM10018784_74220 [Streptomyces hydrogenans]|nr:hypothetical protein GCM10018784_74220 [Streptomyces hydrogenans]